MIAAIVAMVLAVIDPAAASPSPSSAPAQPAKTPEQQARDNLDQAEQIYTQSCGDRAYGAYDDLCSQLSAQVRQDRIDLDRLANAAALRPATTPAAPKS